MKKINKILSIIPFLLIIMIIVFCYQIKYSDSDLYFDLRSGKDLIKYGLDFKDHFCFIPNLKYLYHHYLYDLIIYNVFIYAKYIGLFFFFLIIHTLFGFIVFFVNLSFNKNKIYSLLVTFVTIFLAHGYFFTRVQTISYIIFYLEYYILNKLYDTGEKKYSIILVLLSLLLVNIHMPIWIIFLVLFLPFIAEFIFSKIKKVLNISDKIVCNSPKKAKIFFITCVICTLVGLISPYKLLPYTFFIKVARNSYLYSQILEMKSVVLIRHTNYLLLIISIFLIMIFTKVKINSRHIFLTFGLFILGLMSVRNLAYSYIILPTILFTIIYEQYKMLKIFNYNRKIYVNRKIVYPILYMTLIYTYIMCFTKIDSKNFNYNEDKLFPVKTVQYIKENLDYENAKIYTHFNYGSYVAFNDIPIFVDSRAEVYMADFNGGYDIFNDYYDLVDNPQSIIQKYQLNYFLVYSDSKLNKYLSENQQYKKIYSEKTVSDNYELYEKIS